MARRPPDAPLPHPPTLSATEPGGSAPTASPTLRPALRIRPLAGCPSWTGSPSSSGWPWPCIALCSYAVSATSLYALGIQAGYSWWQAAAVPVVADGPAIYGMFRIISRSRRGAKGAGYGWLLVAAGPPPPSAATSPTPSPIWSPGPSPPPSPWPCWPCWKASRATPARSPAWPPGPLTGTARAALTQPGQRPQATTVRRTDHRQRTCGGGMPRRRRCPPAPTDRRHHVGARLQAAYAQPRPDGQPWTARTLAEAAGCGRSSAARFLQRQRPPAEEHVRVSRPSWQLRDAALGYASRGIPVLPLHYPLPHRGDLQSDPRPISQPALADGLLVSGSGLRPGCQAPPGQPRPPRRQGRHHQPGPGAGLVDPPPPGQHRPGLRPPLRRPGPGRPSGAQAIRTLAAEHGLRAPGRWSQHRQGTAGISARVSKEDAPGGALGLV